MSGRSRDDRRIDGRSGADELERSIREIGTDLASAFPSSARHPLRALDARAMDLASGDRQLRAALFRFVDVTPACRSLDDLARHLREYLREVPDAPPPLAAAMRIADIKAARTALGAAAAAGVRHMAHRFIVGETPSSALGVLRELWNDGVASSVDLLGEATVTQAEADRYAARCDEALTDLARKQAGWPTRDVLERDTLGPIPRTNVSVKISALTPLLRPDAPERGRLDAAARLRPLLRRADELGAHIHIDMESLDSREAVLDLVLEVLSEEEFARGPSAGLVLQAYLRDSPEQLEQVLDWARTSGRTPPLTVRLVSRVCKSRTWRLRGSIFAPIPPPSCSRRECVGARPSLRRFRSSLATGTRRALARLMLRCKPIPQSFARPSMSSNIIPTSRPLLSGGSCRWSARHCGGYGSGRWNASTYIYRSSI